MSTSTLTERYVHEVVRRLPADQRDDIAEELRATIADTVEGRNPADPKSVEREVLSEMGDPVRYAARYADRPLALIGPDLYPSYIRLLVTLLATVLPAITIGLMLLEVMDTDDLGAAIGTGIGTLLTVGSQMIAVVTVLFAVAERRLRHNKGSAAGPAAWTPDDLPEVRQADRGGATAAVAAAVWDALLIGLIVWQHTAKPYRADGARGNGEPIEVLDPGLWSGWIWPVLAGLVGLVAVELGRVAARGWTVRLAAWYALAQATFTLSLAWVLHQQMFFNPAFLADVKTLWTTPGPVYNGAALIVLVMGASAVVKTFRAARG
ncbi:HAAS signaling domain-containing protein [Streptomyces sp. NPDC058572]|uniref:HAAS signaling domain-containing protein n=1 Tax=Streptomyces sp. NPDC058572 TaxID=3346546 RepID=UPI0036510A5D